MKKSATTRCAAAGKKLVKKGKVLQSKPGAVARELTKTAVTTASTASRRLKKGVKKTKSSAAVQKAGKLGRAVGTLVGRAINTAENLVTGAIKRK